MPKIFFNWLSRKPEAEAQPQPFINIDINAPITIDLNTLLMLWKVSKRSAPWLISPIISAWILSQAIGGTTMTEAFCHQHLLYNPLNIAKNN